MSPPARPLYRQPEDAAVGICDRCAHYFVTWDVAKPHGCRAMGLECVSAPCEVVFEVSGTICRAFYSRPAGRS